MLELTSKEAAPGAVVVTLTGRVMIGTGNEKIEAAVREWVDKGARAIIFDLSGVTHMDSSGMGRFIASMSITRPKGVKLLMASASPTVRESFRVTRLDTMFPFFTDPAAALSSL